MTINVAAAKRAIRKALEAPLPAAMAAVPGATKPSIAWPNLPFDAGRLGVTEYVDCQVNFGPSVVLEIGPTPRIKISGFVMIVVRIQDGSGTDRADTIASYVAAAYPYNAKLVRDGVSVIIEQTDVVQGASDGTWWMCPIKVNWEVLQ